MAQAVVDADTIHFITMYITQLDNKLQRQICSCLAHIAKHNIDLAESVVDMDILPNIFICMKSPDPYVRKNAASLICELTKHSPDVNINIFKYDNLFIIIFLFNFHLIFLSIKYLLKKYYY